MKWFPLCAVCLLLFFSISTHKMFVSIGCMIHMYHTVSFVVIWLCTMCMCVCDCVLVTRCPSGPLVLGWCAVMCLNIGSHLSLFKGSRDKRSEKDRYRVRKWGQIGGCEKKNDWGAKVGLVKRPHSFTHTHRQTDVCAHWVTYLLKGTLTLTRLMSPPLTKSVAA